MEYPEDLRYTKEHEWVRAEGGVVRIGITDFAQDALGDVVYVDLPDVATELHAAQAFAEVESTKSVSDVFSPIEGSNVERNPLVDEHPELVNEQPYGDGWLVLAFSIDLSLASGLLRTHRRADRHHRPVAHQARRHWPDPGSGSTRYESRAG